MADHRGVPDLSHFTAPAETYYRLHLEALRERDFNKRVAASWGLIARGGESLPYLMLMLRSRDAGSREDAAGALAWLGTDAGGDTRRCAVESLGKIVRKRFDKQTDPEAAAVTWLDAHAR